MVKTVRQYIIDEAKRQGFVTFCEFNGRCAKAFNKLVAEGMLVPEPRVNPANGYHYTAYLLKEAK